MSTQSSVFVYKLEEAELQLNQSQEPTKTPRVVFKYTSLFLMPFTGFLFLEIGVEQAGLNGSKQGTLRPRKELHSGSLNAWLRADAPGKGVAVWVCVCTGVTEEDSNALT